MEIPLEKDTLVLVGVISANTHTAMWGSDGHEWKPERWLTGLPEEVKKANIPGVYLNT